MRILVTGASGNFGSRAVWLLLATVAAEDLILMMLLISGHKVGWRIKQHGDAIEAAKRAGVSHIVDTSYFGSDAGNTAMVCIDHHGTESKLAEAGVPWTVLRDGMYASSIVALLARRRCRRDDGCHAPARAG
jgi:uncharacterized protein YbjT (DUF2867 family)